MRTLYSYITESESQLQKLMTKTIKHVGNRLLVAPADPEDDLPGWNEDVAAEYSIGELILNYSGMLAEKLGTDMPVIDITEINIQKSARGKGCARRVLREITEWCDKHNFVLTGDPDDMFGSKLEGLYKLYAEFGMMPNPKYDAKKHPYSKIVRWPNGMEPDNQ